MKRIMMLFAIVCGMEGLLFAQSQQAAESKAIQQAAAHFLSSLSAAQKEMALFPFDTAERINWHFIPKDNRKGLPVYEMTEPQRQAAMALLRAALSEQGYAKTTSIMQMENVLREIEHRGRTDMYRNPLKYYFTVFGDPAGSAPWGWRVEGHHVSLNFSATHHLFVSSTPGFMGSNPDSVMSGEQKGKRILKEEAALAFTLLHSFSGDQSAQALFSKTAPPEIVSGTGNRQAMIKAPVGISYNKLTALQQQVFRQLLGVYIHRYTKLFVDEMMEDIQKAGMDKLYFGWAGSLDPVPGQGHYYRIQGPTILIEYDNTQNNANHVHTVVRDLLHDFGGDLLLEHYRQEHGR